MTALDLVMPENITPIFLTPYSPELNPIENVWEYLRKNKPANRLYETYEDIVEACLEAWNSLMAMPNRIASIAARTWQRCQIAAATPALDEATQLLLWVSGRWPQESHSRV